LEFYFGIRQALANFFEEKKKENSIFELDFNVDGLPIAKSSSSQVWPLLMNVVNYKEVLPIALYHSYKKPVCPDEYLKPFVDEFISIAKGGQNLRNIRVKIRCITCDAPANFFLSLYT
jgi:hypothetical protein